MFKETPDGQTHSYNDGCGEPAHNSMTPQPTKEHWAIEFEEVMSWFPRYYRPIQINEDFSKRDDTADIREMLEEKQIIPAIKSFISKTRKEAIQECIKLIKEKGLHLGYKNDIIELLEKL